MPRRHRRLRVGEEADRELLHRLGEVPEGEAQSGQFEPERVDGVLVDRDARRTGKAYAVEIEA